MDKENPAAAATIDAAIAMGEASRATSEEDRRKAYQMAARNIVGYCEYEGIAVPEDILEMAKSTAEPYPEQEPVTNYVYLTRTPDGTLYRFLTLDEAAKIHDTDDVTFHGWSKAQVHEKSDLVTFSPSSVSAEPGEAPDEEDWPTITVGPISGDPSTVLRHSKPTPHQLHLQYWGIASDDPEFRKPGVYINDDDTIGAQPGTLGLEWVPINGMSKEFALELAAALVSAAAALPDETN